MTRIDRQTLATSDTAGLIRLARYLGIPPQDTRSELEEAVVRRLDLIEVFPQFAKLHDDNREKKGRHE